MDKNTDLTATFTIMGFAIAILGLFPLQAPNWLMALVIFWLMTSSLALLYIHGPKRRGAVCQTLGDKHYKPVYHRISTPALNWFWSRLCSPVDDTPPPWRILRAAFSWRLYDKALLLAVVYPIFSLIGVWIITGADARLGNVIVQAAAGFWPARAAAIGVIAMLIFGVLGDKWAAASPKRVIRQASGWPIFIAVAGALEYLDKRNRQALARWLLTAILPLALVVAAVLFLLLGASLTIILSAMNQLAGTPIFDMGTLFAGIRETPSDYWWLYLMLFSTIIPTALHFAIAIFATQALLPLRLRHGLRAMVQHSPDDVLNASFATFALGALWALPFVVFATACWLVWHYVIGDWGIAALGWYFEQIFGLAQWVGAF